MARAETPILGVLEGFYGRPWSRQSRLHMTEWLPRIGIDAYLYAPKADSYLRKSWRHPWPREERSHLQAVGQGCLAHQLQFHVGVSPFELYRDYSRLSKAALQAKVNEILDLGVRGIAILFDDMPGNLDMLADRQAEICSDVRHWVNDDSIVLRLCPTYYSDDPILDEIFGPRPDAYLEDLCANLGYAYEVFWTGPQVCSDTIEPDDIAGVSDLYAGRLAIWDNYPVNDSRARSPHIYMDSLRGRTSALGELIGSHWCNAMNQPALSLAALATLPEVYGQTLGEASRVLDEAGVSPQMIEACHPLSQKTLSGVSSAEHQSLLSVTKSESVAASELRDWLSGGYEFDPECLTC